MEKNQTFSFKQRLKSFQYAFQGILVLYKEHNARIHLTVTILVFLLGFYFHVSPSEWIILILLIGLVFIVEIINTAIEKLCNLIMIEKHPIIKDVKDLSSAAVLFTAVIAVVVGIIIFYPKIL